MSTTSGRAAALGAMRQLRGTGTAPAGARDGVARERLCFPRTRVSWRGLSAGAQAAAALWLDQPALRDIARAHQVCPYFLAQEMARWCDVVIADVNYYFDSSAFLFALAQDGQWRVALLVDEAHNLPERARAMYSASVGDDLLAAARTGAPAPIDSALAALQRQWKDLAPAIGTGAVEDSLPAGLARSMSNVVALLAEHVAGPARSAGPALLQCYFGLLQFARLIESFGSHSVFERGSDPSTGPWLAIRNLIPAGHLWPRFALCASVVCCSGTLSLPAYYRDILGLPADTETLQVESPFRAEQLEVRLAVDLSTRWRDRAGSLERLLDTIAWQFAQQPGNYLALFGSFAYLAQAEEAFSQRHPDVPIWCQHGGMSSAHASGIWQWLRLHLPLPWPAEGGAGCRPSDPQRG